MNLDRINSWISVLANIGVVVGLILLAIEIHQNTNMLRSQISQSRSETAQFEQQSVFNSDYIPAILTKLERGEETLSDEELIRYEFFLRSFHRNQDNVYQQYRMGLLDENVPGSVSSAVRAELGRSPLSLDLWDQSKDVYTDEYTSFVERVISDMRVEPDA